MKKYTLVLVLCLFFVTQNYAQDKNSELNKNQKETIYSSIKPDDIQPAVFNSQAELDSKVPTKKNNIILLIQQNQNDSVKVIYYRKELWRYENAVIQQPR
jgi:hypothetical protein